VDRINQIILSILFSVVLILFGCMGYMFIENWNFFDALYMTVITLATVGYGEVHQVSMTGRLFTLLLIIMGVGYFLYVVGNIIQFLVEGRIRAVLGRRKLDTQIKRLKNHYIICGYGRIGQVLTHYLTQRYLDVVVIERDPERIPVMDEDGVLYLIGEAADEKLLISAGIHRGQGLVTAVATDADNVFLVLRAKQLNPDIFIVARAEHNSVKKTLLAAGADKVISPYDLGARRMAHAILRPTVIKFLEMAFTDDDTDLQVEEIRVGPTSKFAGIPLLDSGIRKNLDLNVLTIRKADDTMVLNPKVDTLIEAGDTIVVVGRAVNIDQLARILGG
jgi:voltage-gated potassium channel